MASGQDEVKFASKAGGSVRSISFLHTERLVPVEEPPLDEEETAEPSKNQTSAKQPGEGLKEEQGSGEKEVTKEPEENGNVEVHFLHNCYVL